MDFFKVLNERVLFFDGALGTMLPLYGLRDGESPEALLYTNFEAMVDFHLSYINAGADVITANTFGANEIKLKASAYDPDETVGLAVKAAKEAVRRSGKPVFVAADIGSTGKLLEPLGDLSFDAAYEAFGRQVTAAEKSGADIVIIETMTDTYEMKAAVLAARENTRLPVVASFSFDEGGRLLMGGDVETAVALLEGLGVDVLGVNCGFGPDKMTDIVDELLKYSSTPVIVQANAGLPEKVGGRFVYNIAPEAFAVYARSFIEKGVRIVGGCCGTTPEYIAQCVELCRDMKAVEISDKGYTVVSSFAEARRLDGAAIGERIDHADKKAFNEVLLAGDYDYILTEALERQDEGAHVIDVNVGVPGINEEEAMLAALSLLQPIIRLPLRICTEDATVMEKALRYYNGKALVSCLSGAMKSMEAVFPLIKKYGGVAEVYCVDENGIPQSAKERKAIAERIIRTAESFGIKSKDILILE